MATPAACIICSTPVRLPLSADRLCGSAQCEWRAQLLPAHARCRICARPLARDEVARETCANRQCQVTFVVRRQLQSRREKQKLLNASALELRDAHPATAVIADRNSWPLVVTPSTASATYRLPLQRRKALRAHVATIAAKVRAHLDEVAAGREAPKARPARSGPLDSEIGKVMVQACIGCRGHCCRQGGERAFLDFDTILHFMLDHPHHSVNDVVTAYVERLPARSIMHGCVFQHARGCTLPREMRADICNRYYCGTLSELKKRVDAGAPPRAFFVPDNESTADRGVFASPNFVQIVRAPRAK